MERKRQDALSYPPSSLTTSNTKKNNGCLPPGLSEKYVVGDVMPPDYLPLPPVLLKRLAPPPQGTFYAIVDSDVVLVAEAGKKILDAVTLLSAVK